MKGSNKNIDKAKGTTNIELLSIPYVLLFSFLHFSFINFSFVQTFFSFCSFDFFLSKEHRKINHRCLGQQGPQKNM